MRTHTQNISSHVRILRVSQISKMAEVRVRVTAAALATLNMSVMTGAFSLTLTSHTLPPSSTGTTSCESVEVHACVWRGRVIVGFV